MSSPEKKRKTTKQPAPEPTLIQSLPYDLQLNCFARVSRLYYPTLSLVSKSFGSFLYSPELYQARSIFGRTESCLYVCLRYGLDSKPCWFTLCRKPNPTITKGTTKSSEYALARIPISRSLEAHHAGLVSVGCNIYAIGIDEPVKYVPSSNVWKLDCRFHTWHEVPSMQVKRSYPAANVVDGKIYVVGGSDFSNWMEVFDPNTQTWEKLFNPLTNYYNNIRHKSVLIHMLVKEYERATYKPNEGSWKSLRDRTNMGLGCSWLSYCVIDNVPYCYSELNEINWYDTQTRTWMELKGLKELPKFDDFYGLVKLVDYGGKMAVFWDKDESSSGNENIVIWCAVIALKRLNNEEIFGEVEWYEEVLTVPKTYGFVNALAVTV